MFAEHILLLLPMSHNPRILALGFAKGKHIWDTNATPSEGFRSEKSMPCSLRQHNDSNQTSNRQLEPVLVWQ
jgi:hypothetical protein